MYVRDANSPGEDAGRDCKASLGYMARPCHEQTTQGLEMQVSHGHLPSMRKARLILSITVIKEKF